MAEEHVAALKRARARMIELRRQLANSLGQPYDRGKTEQWRKDLIDVQTTIRTINEALEDESKSTERALVSRASGSR